MQKEEKGVRLKKSLSKHFMASKYQTEMSSAKTFLWSNSVKCEFLPFFDWPSNFNEDCVHVILPLLMLMFIFLLSDDSFDVGATLELLFNIRPRAPSGLLLHVGDSSRTLSESVMSHFLTVYMLRGEVRMFCCLLLSK